MTLTLLLRKHGHDSNGARHGQFTGEGGSNGGKGTLGVNGFKPMVVT